MNINCLEMDGILKLFKDEILKLFRGNECRNCVFIRWRANELHPMKSSKEKSFDDFTMNEFPFLLIELKIYLNMLHLKSMSFSSSRLRKYPISCIMDIKLYADNQMCHFGSAPLQADSNTRKNI